MTSTAAHEDEERSLTALYTRRQDLLKELTDTDNQIKALEQKQLQRQQQLVQQRQAVLAMSSGDQDLDSIRDIIEKATHDQSGLREAQKALEAACRIERVADESDEAYAKRRRYRNMFVWQVIERSKELMLDPNGNYFVQRALSLFKNNGSRSPDEHDLSYDVTEDASLSEVIALLDRLGPDISEVACNMHGTRAIQRIIDSLVSIEEFELFCDLVANDLVSLIKDLNGNHSISRLLVSQSFMQLGEQSMIPSPDGSGLIPNEAQREKGQSVRKDVYHVVAANCVEICRNRQGCCIIQRCLQWAPEPFRTDIINAALLNSLKLVQDPFGNYVVQYILDLQQQLVQSNPAEAEAQNYTNRIIRQILHNVALLSCNKFSSNVIEKCLRTSSPDVRQLLIDELTDPQSLPKLLTDSFANYVIQTAITCATDEMQFAQLRDAIQPLQHLLKNSPYGVKIEAKLLKRHRDAAKKMNRQIRQQREASRATQQPGGSGGSSTSHTPTGQSVMASQQQMRQHIGQHPSQQPFTQADFSNLAAAQQQQQLVMLQQQSMSHHSGRTLSNTQPNSQNFATIQMTQAPQGASFMQLFAAPQQAQGTQAQQGSVQFMVAPQMVAQHTTTTGQQQQQGGASFITMALQQQPQQQQSSGGWAVSSQGAYAVPSQQAQQRGSNPNRSPATHSPYTTFSGAF